MKEKPILFSGPMVRAILEGRKTQTRRVVKPQPLQPGPQCLRLYSRPDGLFVWCSESGVALMEPHEMRCPYGQPSDRLWVRETWGKDDSGDFVFRADDWCECPTADGKWKPSIFMPRSASRIALEITAVRVERLQSITNDDARAEGIQDQPPRSWLGGGWREKAAYQDLWETINGPGSWSKNPWVWCLEFRRLQPA